MRCPMPWRRSAGLTSIGRQSMLTPPSRRKVCRRPVSWFRRPMQRSIGDVLTAHNIPWKYYGGGFNASGTTSPFNGSYCNICNPFEYEASYPSMVADHMRDVTD